MHQPLRVLLVNVPSRVGKGGFMLPLGLLYVAGILQRSGAEGKILDLYLADSESAFFSDLDGEMERFRPQVVGLGGIGSSYSWAKTLALRIRERWPQVRIIAGGALSSVGDLLLKKAGVDCVFYGETENSLPRYLEALRTNGEIWRLPGIAFRTEDGHVRWNPPSSQLENLDEIPIPPYHLVDLRRYCVSIRDWIDIYPSLNHSYPGLIERLKGLSEYYIPIVGGRGCTHSCFFCYRHMKGVRKNSPAYLVRHMKFLKETYGIGGFQICDELFNTDSDWVLDFCRQIDEARLNIFYLIGGARVDRMDAHLLKRLRETGCIEINYGQETGSDLLLREIKKGVDAAQNLAVSRMTIEAGIHCPVQLVLGMPSESPATIRDTLAFLRKLNGSSISFNFLIPFPKTPSWGYLKKRGIQVDEEEYLQEVARVGGGRLLLNLTRYPDWMVRFWGLQILHLASLLACKEQGRPLGYLFRFLWYRVKEILIRTLSLSRRWLGVGDA
ncbi:MAG TPA: radical SAM protein [Candidatus Ozemobacteraceae bacterium]